MQINSYNQAQYIPTLQAQPSPPAYTGTQATSSQPNIYTPANQTIPSNSQQYGMPVFQGNGSSFFSPISQSVSNWGGNLLNSFNSGISSLWPAPSTQQTQQIQQAPPLHYAQPIQQVQAPATTNVKPYTAKQKLSNFGQGAKQGIIDFAKMAKKNAPMMLTMGAGLAGGGAVCAFMGGTLAATGGALLAQQHNSANA